MLELIANLDYQELLDATKATLLNRTGFVGESIF
jgi:hypothetical protein